jgi:hypothetical protein
VKNPFIIREMIVGYLVRIQIDLGLDLDYILERFIKKHNLPSRKHLDVVRIRRFNRNLIENVDK